MKSVHRVCLSAAQVVMILFASGRTFGQALVGGPRDSEFKFSTPAAPGVAVPDKIDSSIGTLNLKYGYPKADTVEKIYDNLDRSRALQAYLMAIPIVNQAGMRDPPRSTCDQVHQCLGYSCQRCCARQFCILGTPEPDEGFLVGHRVRQSDAFDGPDGSEIPEPEQPEQGAEDEHRRVCGCLFWPAPPDRTRKQLGADPARQGLVYDPAPLRTARTVV